MRTRILGTGHYVPDRVVTNADLTRWMETTDEWIVERTGIRERRWVTPEMTGAEMAERAARAALEAAELAPGDLDLIVYATLSPDQNFPGTGVFLQARLGLSAIPVLDIRQQCTGFIYGLQVADLYLRGGAARRALVVGCEIHSTGIDVSTRGRDVTVIFGDGAGAAVLAPSDRDDRGLLSVRAYADGHFAEMLWCEMPGSAYHPRISAEGIAEGRHFPKMQGKHVFKHAVTRMPESVRAACADAGVAVADLDLVIPHQANLRISEAARQQLGLPEDRFYSNIQRYGNTTAASIPIALDECVREGRVREGSLVCLTAFGSGFTWGAVLLRW